MRSLLLLLLLLQLVSCEPRPVDPYSLKYVALTADIPIQGALKLGDTLKIRYNVPDSLEYSYYENGMPKTSKVYVNTINDLLPSSFPTRFDTLNGGVYPPDRQNTHFSIAGLGNFSKRPFYYEDYVIPKFKGVYYVELRGGGASDNGIKINNDFEARLSLAYNTNININAEMYCRQSISNTYNNDIQLCLGDVNNRRRFYCFKVE